MTRKPDIKPRVKPCSDCPTLITKKATRCAPCNRKFMAGDPAIRQNRSEAVSRFFRDNPDKASENARRAAKARLANPVNLERLRATMRAIQVLSYTPEVLARRDFKASRAKVINAQMAWCPPEYRKMYFDIMRRRRKTSAYAKAIVLARIKADEAQLSPFEKQERALARGAQLVSNDRGPSLDRPSLYGKMAG